MRYYLMATEGGFPQAHIYIAELYESGRGLMHTDKHKDIESAKTHYEAAVLGGSNVAVGRLKALQVKYGQG